MSGGCCPISGRLQKHSMRSFEPDEAVVFLLIQANHRIECWKPPKTVQLSFRIQFINSFRCRLLLWLRMQLYWSPEQLIFQHISIVQNIRAFIFRPLLFCRSRALCATSILFLFDVLNFNRLARQTIAVTFDSIQQQHFLMLQK